MQITDLDAASLSRKIHAKEVSCREVMHAFLARIRQLKSVQDMLGRMHDLEVLIARTRSIQSSPGASTLKVSADLDRLVRRLETECRQLHGHYMAARPALVQLCHRLMAASARKTRERTRSSAA